MQTVKTIDWRERSGVIAAVLLSFALLLAVSWHEALRTSRGFHEQQMQTQGRLLQAAIERHLQAGLALEQYAGFPVQAAEWLRSDPELTSIGVRAPDGTFLFNMQGPSRNDLTLLLPLNSRFEKAGDLIIAKDAEAPVRPLRGHVPIAGILAVVLSWWAANRMLRSAREDSDPLPRQRRVLVTALLLQTLAIVCVMALVYVEGARRTAQSQAELLVTRLAAIPQHGLSLDDFSDLSDVLSDERQRSGTLREISLRQNDRVLVRSRDAESLLHVVPTVTLTARRTVAGEEPLDLSVQMVVPLSIITQPIVRNLRNFGFLLVAVVLMSMLMLRIAHGFASDSDRAQQDAHRAKLESYKAAALLFVAVMCDQLVAASLPPWIRDLAARDGYRDSAASWAFAAYFISFAAVMLPAEAYASRHSARRLMLAGALAIAAGAALLASVDVFWMAIAARSLSGAGQALVFVATQSLLLAWSRKAGALGANTSIVYQFNAGMICGLALGSLLIQDLALPGILWLIAGLAGLIALMIPALSEPGPMQAVSAHAGPSASPGWRNTWRDAGFALPTLFVGIPSKAVMTGVIVFGLPLLLTAQGFSATETGQMLLFYALGVLASNAVIQKARPADRALRHVTHIAMLLSAAALAALGLFPGSPILQLMCILLLGLSHGAINAPVVTLVALSAVAKQSSESAVATQYRLVERIGHVAGPAIFAQLAIWAGSPQSGLLWWAALLLLAVLLSITGTRWLCRTGPVTAACMLVVLLTAGFSPDVVAQSRMPSLNADNLQQWEMKQAESGLQGVAMAEWQPRFETVTRQQVWMIMTKSSGAYDVAINRMMRVWAERRLSLRVRIVFAGESAAQLHAVMRDAVNNRASLVVAVGSDAAAFLHAHYRTGPVPLLSVCAKDPVLMKQVADYSRGSQTSMAYTSLNPPVAVQLSYLQQARPGLAQISILVDRGNSSAMQTQTLPLEERARREGIAVFRVEVDSQSGMVDPLRERMAAALQRMRQQDPDGGRSIFWVTGSSSLFPLMGIINEAASGIPVFSAVPDLVVAGADSAAVSIGIGFEENAHLAALYAQRILSGQAKPGDLPVGVVTPPEIAIHFMKARQSGLRIPFALFEQAATVFDGKGQLVRLRGRRTDASD